MQRFTHSALLSFASDLLTRAGMQQTMAAAVADVLTEGDLLGYSTHGLSLLAAYLRDIDGGTLRTAGAYRVLADYPAALTWDGERLPGAWLVLRAIEAAIPRAKTLGTCTVIIRRSHHIGCLAAYLQRVTAQGLMLILSTSDPDNHSVAPYGAREGVITPNPIAAGWPTDGDPVMIDVSTSITTNGMVGRKNDEGARLPGKWLVDAAGQATDDPGVMLRHPKGALLPIGGIEYGHKGYALGLLVETLTMALAGHGRADASDGWTGEIFLQVLDPQLFAGRTAFLRQSSWLADACRAAAPLPGHERVRLPGERGLALRAQQLRDGVAVQPTVFAALQPWMQRFALLAPLTI